MPDDARTVLTTLPLEIGGTKQPAGTELTLPASEADAMVLEGRAQEAASKPKPRAEKAPAAPEPQPAA